MLQTPKQWCHALPRSSARVKRQHTTRNTPSPFTLNHVYLQRTHVLIYLPTYIPTHTYTVHRTPYNTNVHNHQRKPIPPPLLLICTRIHVHINPKHVHLNSSLTPCARQPATAWTTAALAAARAPPSRQASQGTSSRTPPASPRLPSSFSARAQTWPRGRSKPSFAAASWLTQRRGHPPAAFGLRAVRNCCSAGVGT